MKNCHYDYVDSVLGVMCRVLLLSVAAKVSRYGQRAPHAARGLAYRWARAASYWGQLL